MKHLVITITGNSNKLLDAEAASIVSIARKTGAVKSGPIPMKGKRIVHIYNWNTVTINRLLAHKGNNRLNYNVLHLSSLSQAV